MSVFLFGNGYSFAQGFSVESVTSYPFPSESAAAQQGSKIAFSVNEEGRRNVYTAKGPAFTLKKITRFDADDGQEISSLSVSNNGKWIVFVRGGDHGSDDYTAPRNPASSPVAAKVQVMSIPFDGGPLVVLEEGDEPTLSPDGSQVAFIKNGAAWTVAVDGSRKARQMFYARGQIRSISWSPDGRQLLFLASRKDHSFIGIFTDSLTPLRWIAPALAKDLSPVWSPDGKKIVFARTLPVGGRPDSLTSPPSDPWSLWIADAATGAARQIWQSPVTLRGSVPGTQGGFNLHWCADNRILFMSYQDGWPHLYSITPAGGEPLRLTTGRFLVEHVSISPDKKWIVASANTGPDSNDLHRRHIIKVAVDKPGTEMITTGNGIETFPLVTGDGKNIIVLSATAQRPAVPARVPFNGGALSLIGQLLIPKGFPSAQLVIPSPVSFSAADGGIVYGQLFRPASGPARKPAIVFVHGGPARQMLLGWHYGDYYSNTYAVNQYLASQGYVVLSVNYRLGIGYGFEFQNPAHSWLYGASEYQDIKAAGQWLAALPEVDPQRIGIYGGSYGGFLTALALGKDSKLFAAGVDIHGVHNLTGLNPDKTGEQAPDAALARQLSWHSSPVAWLDNWTSPVLLIHGDDDGNVEFSQSLDLAQRFMKKGFIFESLVIPDETHHWLKHSNLVKVDSAIADFFKRKL